MHYVMGNSRKNFSKSILVVQNLSATREGNHVKPAVQFRDPQAAPPSDPHCFGLEVRRPERAGAASRFGGEQQPCPGQPGDMFVTDAPAGRGGASRGIQLSDHVSCLGACLSPGEPLLELPGAAAEHSEQGGDSGAHPRGEVRAGHPSADHQPRGGADGGRNPQP